MCWPMRKRSMHSSPGVEAADRADGEAHKQVARASTLENTIVAQSERAQPQAQNGFECLEKLDSGELSGFHGV